MHRASSCAEAEPATGSAGAVFVSDLHLESEGTPRHRAFSDFLAGLAARARPPRLYVLGDLFNYWAGPVSERALGHRMVLADLARTARAGVEVAILRGNRDFLLDGRVAVRCGVRVPPGGLTLDLGPHRVFICHGDTLLLHDRAHLRFRSVIRSFWIRALVDLLPGAAIDAIARRLRRRTAALTDRKAPRTFEIPPRAAARLFRAGHDVIVCGHVHAQACRRLVVDGRDCLFYTLGAWEKEASVLEYDGDGFRFETFPIEGTAQSTA